MAPEANPPRPTAGIGESAPTFESIPIMAPVMSQDSESLGEAAKRSSGSRVLAAPRCMHYRPPDMFVLLEHRAPAGTHWDFMVEIPERALLATWRLSRNPIEEASPIPAERLPDHRTIYLDFEGDLGAGRGQVSRLDRGEAVVRSAAGDVVRFELRGERLKGAVMILDVPGGGEFRRTAAGDADAAASV